jgi:hypothetical protein
MPDLPDFPGLPDPPGRGADQDPPTAEQDVPTGGSTGAPTSGPRPPLERTGPETDTERRRRRARFLRELAEARELRDRVQPRRAKAARLRHAMRMRTFRW